MTHDQVHHSSSLQVIAANKHILCEKPLAVSYQDARELLADGCIGQIKHFEASYLQSWLAQPAWGKASGCGVFPQSIVLKTY